MTIAVFSYSQTSRNIYIGILNSRGSRSTEFRVLVAAQQSVPPSNVRWSGASRTAGTLRVFQALGVFCFQSFFSSVVGNASVRRIFCSHTIDKRPYGFLLKLQD